MIKNIQTRLHKGFDRPEDRGNCYPAVISCILEIPVEEVIQFQELYHEVWYEPLCDWLESRGYEIMQLIGHQNDGDFYFVSGTSPRDPNVSHIVIYQNGVMVHDTHPDNTGILDEKYFEKLIPLCRT